MEHTLDFTENEFIIKFIKEEFDKWYDDYADKRLFLEMAKESFLKKFSYYRISDVSQKIVDEIYCFVIVFESEKAKLNFLLKNG
jgi:hypothetical protein